MEFLIINNINYFNPDIILLTEAKIDLSVSPSEFLPSGYRGDIHKDRITFDTVPHDRLLSKLEHYGIIGPILNWIGMFLKEREQWVLVSEAASSQTSIDWGLPQGTELAPLLFLLHINHPLKSDSLQTTACSTVTSDVGMTRQSCKGTLTCSSNGETPGAWS